MDLSAQDQEILVFESRRWSHAGAKETAIRDLFDLSTTRYYARLNQLIEDPGAMAAAPLVVGRLQRIRDQRLTVRAGSRGMGQPELAN